MNTILDARLFRLHTLLGLSLLSAFAIAQTVEHFDPQHEFDDRITSEIYDSAGQWRQPEPEEFSWRASEDDTVQDRRFHFGADSAYEEMRYRGDEFRTQGSNFDQVQPYSIFRYNF